MKPFTARPASTVNIDVSAASQSIKVDNLASATVRVVNNGSATVWIAFGNSAVTAALATGAPVPPGTVEVLGAGSGDNTALYVAAIAAAATGKIYFTPGSGI